EPAPYIGGADEMRMRGAVGLVAQRVPDAPFRADRAAPRQRNAVCIGRRAVDREQPAPRALPAPRRIDQPAGFDGEIAASGDRVDTERRRIGRAAGQGGEDERALAARWNRAMA